MKTSGYIILIAAALLLIVTFVNIDESEASPAPDPKKGGGRSRSSSGSKSSSGSGSSWFGGSSKKNKNKNYGNSGSGTHKKKSKYSTLKKAAVVGVGVYGAYQLGKMTSRWGHYGHGGGWNQRQYNSWREIDGFMCRNNQDCNWVDKDLYCQDYELKFTPSALWFGGDAASIIGECACPYGQVWDNYEMECETNFFSGTTLVLVILIPLLVLCCCCCCGIYIARKMFN